MDPFKKSLLIYGLMIPLLMTTIICVGMNTVQGDIQRQYLQKKIIFDEMMKQEAILKKTTQQQQVIKQELPLIRSYFLPTHITQATATIASQCSEEKGLKLGDLKQIGSSDSTKSASHQLKLLGRSAPLLEILGEAQGIHPALHFDQWSIGLQMDQKVLLFQGTLQLVNIP